MQRGNFLISSVQEWGVGGCAHGGGGRSYGTTPAQITSHPMIHTTKIKVKKIYNFLLIGVVQDGSEEKREENQKMTMRRSRRKRKRRTWRRRNRRRWKSKRRRRRNRRRWSRSRWKWWRRKMKRRRSRTQ